MLEVVVQDLAALTRGQVRDVNDDLCLVEEGEATGLEVLQCVSQDVAPSREHELGAAVDRGRDLGGDALPALREERSQLGGTECVVKPEQLPLVWIPSLGELRCVIQHDDVRVEHIGCG